MQVESGQLAVEKEEHPFEIQYNARSSKASRSRKSSIHTMDREKTKQKHTKKLRKMTMNPQVFHFQQQLTQIKEQSELKAVRSEKNQIEEEDFSVSDFLEYGGPIKTQSKKEQELQNGIFFGLASERELDSDFNLGLWQQNQMMDLEMRE